jgi:hypothetical protein
MDDDATDDLNSIDKAIEALIVTDADTDADAEQTDSEPVELCYLIWSAKAAESL